MRDPERFARLQNLGEDHLGLTVHGSPAQIAKERQAADHGPPSAALHYPTLPAETQSRSYGPVKQAHSRLISIQVDLLLPRFRPIRKASPTSTKIPTISA